ncbi:MAG: FAD-dependent oxidoreductase [Nitrososphaeria archaeon]
MEFLFNVDVEKPIMSTGKRVAIVGGGPSGLSAAKELFKLGYEIHVYEKMPEAGGLLLFGIPDFRIDKGRVREMIRKLIDLGIVFYTNVNVGKDIPFEDLIKRYDAVLLATGAWESRRLYIPGEDLDGVYYALDYIIEYNLSKLGWIKNNTHKLHGHVSVIGGGLTAVDACHIALQNKVDSITLIYRRGKENSPAGRRAIENLEKSGVKVMEYTQPLEFIGEKGRVKGINAVKTMIVKRENEDEIIIVPNSNHFIPADNILIAAGLNRTFPKTSYNPCIEVLKEYKTNIDKVFVAGDALLGPSYIGLAIQSGKKAAMQIHEFLAK